jgi:hypothetical protein
LISAVAEVVFGSSEEASGAVSQAARKRHITRRGAPKRIRFLETLCGIKGRDE